MFEHLDDEAPFVPGPALHAAVVRDGARRRTRGRWWIGGAGVALPALVLVGSLARRPWPPGPGRLSVADVAQVGPDGRPATANVDDLDRPFTVLVVGTDTRPGVAGGPRTDVIMVMTVDVPGRAVRVLSLPRDLWVPLAGGRGDARIDTALGHGRDTLLATVNRVVGVTVDHYAEVDFDGFAAVVDAGGGVPVVVDAALRDPSSGLDLDAGCRLLDGRAALGLVRARHLLVAGPDGRWQPAPPGDLGRVARQQALIQAAAGRAAHPTADVAGLVRAVSDGVTLDDHLGVADLARLAAWAVTLGPDGVRSWTPDVRPAEGPGGEQVLQLEPGAAEAAARFLAGALPPPERGPAPAGDALVRPAPGGAC